MSCIASFEEWSNIFRHRSFTLCKNVRDSSERFDFVMVSESISSSSMTNLFVSWVNCCNPRISPFLLPTFRQISTHEKTTFRQCSILSCLMSERAPQVSLFLVAAQSMSSEVFDFHDLVFPGLSDAVRRNSSSALILLRRFLHLHLLAFFSTSLQNNWWN